MVSKVMAMKASLTIRRILIVKPIVRMICNPLYEKNHISPISLANIININLTIPLTLIIVVNECLDLYEN